MPKLTIQSSAAGILRFTRGFSDATPAGKHAEIALGFHGTSARHARSILRHGIKDPLYFGDYLVARRYALAHATPRMPGVVLSLSAGPSCINAPRDSFGAPFVDRTTVAQHRVRVQGHSLVACPDVFQAPESFE